MYSIQQTASEYYGMQKGFLNLYKTNVTHFMSEMLELDEDKDSSVLASLVLELKRNTIAAYHDLQFFKKQICTYLLEVYPGELKNWINKLKQLICIQLQGTLSNTIKELIRKHREFFNFSRRDVCQQATYLLEHPNQVNHMDLGPMNICVLYVINKRLFSLLKSCWRELVHRTNDDVVEIYTQRWSEYRRLKSFKSLNLFTHSYNRLTGDGKLTQAQYNILFDSIFNEIKDEELRSVVEGYIDEPIGLIKELQELGYTDGVMDQVFCAYTKKEELDRRFEQREEPEKLNYNQKRTAFLTECVKEIQAAIYSKDGEKLIRCSNEWFFVHRIFQEKDVKQLSLRKVFVKMLQSLDIKVNKLPQHPNNLNRVAQEFKERNYPDWEPVDGRSAVKYERYLEIGAATLKAYEKHKSLLK